MSFGQVITITGPSTVCDIPQEVCYEVEIDAGEQDCIRPKATSTTTTITDPQGNTTTVFTASSTSGTILPKDPDCWDFNFNGMCDISYALGEYNEDKNLDGVCDVDDCLDLISKGDDLTEEDLNREQCFTFTEPGTYVICVEVKIFCRGIWIFGESFENIKTCKTIYVGGEEPEYTPSHYFCDGDIFSWCPGDYGISDLGSLSHLACDPSETLPDGNGCVEFEVCADDWDELSLTYDTMLETQCSGPQPGTVEIVFQSCFHKNDDVYARSSNGSEKTNGSAVSDKPLRIHLSPNPARDFMNINTTSFNCKLSVLDLSGRLQEQRTFSYNTKIDVSDYIPGIYFLLIDNGFETSVEKVIVE